MAKAKSKQVIKKTKKSSVAPARPIQGLIRALRGQKIILDSDLAVLHQVSTGAMNRQ